MGMSPTIIAVMMVKNEDLYIDMVIEGVQEFADDILFIDTGSTDGTVDIARAMGVTPITEPDLLKTHDYVQGFAGQDMWLFGVDGDEIYDRAELRRMRKQMADGQYDGAYQVQGWYLHVEAMGGGTARGYFGPPSHAPTKLYNMKNIPAWPSDGKRTLFHPKTRTTTGEKMRAQPDTWQQTPLRCLHTRFLTRSTLERKDTDGLRLHPEDLTGHGNRKDRGDMNDKNMRMMYRKGGLHEVAIWL